MKYDKLQFQNRVETFFDSSGSDWKHFKETFILDTSKAFILNEDLKSDAKYFYFKGILSLAQGLMDVKDRLYSWATVKFYYSNFYFLRSSLCIKGEGFFRHERELLYLTARSGQIFSQVKEMHKDGKTSPTSSDHRATISLFKKLYGNNNLDQIQTNTIDSKNPYDWLIEQREIINYKQNTFLEPDLSEIWESIHNYVRKKKFEKLINDYLNDKTYIYCFQEEDALIALPIKRMQETKSDFVRYGITDLISNEKKKFLYHTLKINKEISKKIIE
jgi:hypothetical protein